MKPVYVSVTVDVESPQTPLFERRLQDDGIWCNGHGLELLLTIFERHGVVGSLFTNVYEWSVWGREEMRRVLTAIHGRGHQAELHTHPIWLDELRRENMNQFSLQEQLAIIKEGAAFIQDAVGRRPLAHRAGAYGFNRDTLKACAQAGLQYDSSNYFGHPNCQAIVTQNKLVRAEGIIEAPVTFLVRDNQPIKTDTNWISPEELAGFVAGLKERPGLNFLNLFMHSYSLMSTPDNFATLMPNPAAVERLERMLALLAADPDCVFTPIAELAPALRALENPAAAPEQNKQGFASAPAKPKQEDKPNPIQKVIAGHPGKVLVFLNAPEAAALAEGCDFGEQVVLLTTREHVWREARRRGLNPLTPEARGRLFLFDHLPFDDIQHLRESKGYSPTRYQYVFDDIARSALLENPQARYCGEYDLYMNGDYNAANVLGHKMFYSIEVISDLLAELKPDLVVCVDGPQVSLESYVVENHLQGRAEVEVRFLRVEQGRAA